MCVIYELLLTFVKQNTDVVKITHSQKLHSSKVNAEPPQDGNVKPAGVAYLNQGAEPRLDFCLPPTARMSKPPEFQRENRFEWPVLLLMLCTRGPSWKHKTMPLDRIACNLSTLEESTANLSTCLSMSCVP